MPLMPYVIALHNSPGSADAAGGTPAASQGKDITAKAEAESELEILQQPCRFGVEEAGDGRLGLELQRRFEA